MPAPRRLAPTMPHAPAGRQRGVRVPSLVRAMKRPDAEMQDAGLSLPDIVTRPRDARRKTCQPRKRKPIARGLCCRR